MRNGTMMQYFEWYIPNDSSLWRKVAKEASNLNNVGITAVWLPPAYKGNEGVNDVGYSVYDLYDLGEFNQKGSIPTKYGTKEEYVAAIRELNRNNIDVYGDISLDHKIGADETERVYGSGYEWNDRHKKIIDEKLLEVWTKFTFPGRNGKYSDFKWNWSHFDAVDWDEISKTKAVFMFYRKEWDEGVDEEYGNFDYLMGADLQLSNEEVIKELKSWGRWYLETTGVNGFRIDAAKHTSHKFILDWIETLRQESGKELFSVAEYWNPDINVLKRYIEATKGKISLFDVALHYHFYDAAKAHENYDLRNIFKGTLVETDPVRAVTFVDNHDTQIGQSLESWVEDWFKPLAYGLILLRAEGYPCIFYGDYYGILENDCQPINNILDKMLLVRRDYAYGEQIDYFNNPNLIAWVRNGDDRHTNSGVVVLISNKNKGMKEIILDKKFCGKSFYDVLGNVEEIVTINEEGRGNFLVNENSISVWITNEL